MSVPISLSRVFFPVTSLGPGRRVGIWFQGCSLKCAGCISMDTWGRQPPQMTVQDLLRKCSAELAVADGVTITGGEPFEQPEALRELLYGVRSLLQPQGDVFVYSGFQLESLASPLTQMQGLIDVLCTGPFDINSDQSRPLMGSDNQELVFLTEAGTRSFSAYRRERSAGDDVLDVNLESDGTVWLAGIPRRGDLRKLQSMLGVQGYQVVTTEDGRS